MAYYIRTLMGRPKQGSRQAIFQLLGPFTSRERARAEAMSQNATNPKQLWEVVDALFYSHGIPEVRKQKARARKSLAKSAQNSPENRDSAR